MKTIDTVSVNEKLPEYFTEKWFDDAIKNLELSNLSQEERANYSIALAKEGASLGY